MSVHIVSKQTQKNWWIDLTLFSSALMAALSGIYFLFLPSNGYQGGRNPLYNVQFIFDRQTWDDLHTWGGLAMIVVASIHLVIHWKWVVSMARRSWYELPTQKPASGDNPVHDKIRVFLSFSTDILAISCLLR